MQTTLQKWGNSQGVRLPKAIIDSLGIAVGAQLTVEVSRENCQITIAPTTDLRAVRGRHRIEDLIADSSPKAFEGAYDWGTPQGKEVW